MLILFILMVGKFLQDQKNNYLEGTLSVLYYPLTGVKDGNLDAKSLELF